MRLTKLSVRSAAVIAAAAGLVAGLLAAPPSAQAAPAPVLGLAAAPDAAALASQLDSAGSYYDQATGRMVVTVTDAAAAETVEAAGAVARVVRYDADDLAAVTSALAAAPDVAGTAWAVNPVTNRVEVMVDSTVSAAELATIKAVTNRFGSAATIQRTSGEFSPFISGGDAIYGGGSRCSLGFNVLSTSTQNHYLITAGHCTNIASTWYANSARTTLIGPRVVSSFPGNDYGLVRYDGSVSSPSNVNRYDGSFQNITSVGNAFVGQSVERSGSTTGRRSGSVTGLNATVNYAQGTVTGMIRTNVCAQPGDSGGSLFSGSVALGITSGGSGNCTTGGTTFFQPVNEVFSVYPQLVLG